MFNSLKPGQSIEIFFGDDGSTRIEAKGFMGRSCVEATKKIEELLGKAGPRKYKSEFREKLKQPLVR
jgi:hypothetical protein